jgi:hypothetical protein
VSTAPHRAAWYSLFKQHPIHPLKQIVSINGSSQSQLGFLNTNFQTNLIFPPLSAPSLSIDMTPGIMDDISTPSIPVFECPESPRTPSVITDDTDASSDTVTGLGILSGRMVLGLGDAIKRGVENISIRKKLGMIVSIYPHDDDAPPENIGRLYDDLLELSRCIIVLLLKF